MHINRVGVGQVTFAAKQNPEYKMPRLDPKAVDKIKAGLGKAGEFETMLTDGFVAKAELRSCNVRVPENGVAYCFAPMITIFRSQGVPTREKTRQALAIIDIDANPPAFYGAPGLYEGPANGKLARIGPFPGNLVRLIPEAVHKLSAMAKKFPKKPPPPGPDKHHRREVGIGVIQPQRRLSSARAVKNRCREVGIDVLSTLFSRAR